MRAGVNPIPDDADILFGDRVAVDVAAGKGLSLGGEAIEVRELQIGRAHV